MMIDDDESVTLNFAGNFQSCQDPMQCGSLIVGTCYESGGKGSLSTEFDSRLR